MRPSFIAITSLSVALAGVVIASFSLFGVKNDNIVFLEFERQKLVEINRDLVTKHAKLSTENNRLVKEGRQLERLNNDLKTKSQELMTHNTKLSTENDKLTTRVQELERLNNDLKTKSQELMTHNTKLSTENDKLTTRVQELERLNNNPKTKAQELGKDAAKLLEGGPRLDQPETEQNNAPQTRER